MNPLYKLYLRIKRRDYCFKHDHPKQKYRDEGETFWICEDCDHERTDREKQRKQREVQRYYE